MATGLFMAAALEEAKTALSIKEFPIGCVIVKNNKIIARAHNQTNTLSNPLAHAEILCLKQIENYEDITIYVNVEPCIMCMTILERIKCKVYYGVSNMIFGGTSVLNIQYGDALGCDDSIDLMKMFYSMENENAPETLRKNKLNRKKHR